MNTVNVEKELTPNVAIVVGNIVRDVEGVR